MKKYVFLAVISFFGSLILLNAGETGSLSVRASKIERIDSDKFRTYISVTENEVPLEQLNSGIIKISAKEPLPKADKIKLYSLGKSYIPADYAIVIDNGDIIKGEYFERQIEGIRNFIKGAHEKDSFSLFPIVNGSVPVTEGITKEMALKALDEIVTREDIERGKDAATFAYAHKALSQRQGERRKILILSGNMSYLIDEESDTWEDIGKGEVIVCAVKFTATSHPPYDQSRDHCFRSGGRYLFCGKDAETIPEAFNRLHNLINSYYVLEFRLPKAKPARSSIEFKVEYEGVNESYERKLRIPRG